MCLPFPRSRFIRWRRAPAATFSSPRAQRRQERKTGSVIPPLASHPFFFPGAGPAPPLARSLCCCCCCCCCCCLSFLRGLGLSATIRSAQLRGGSSALDSAAPKPPAWASFFHPLKAAPSRPSPPLPRFPRHFPAFLHARKGAEGVGPSNRDESLQAEGACAPFFLTPI